MVAVYAEQGGKEALERHVKREKVSYPVIWDRGDRISTAYGISEVGRRYPVTPTLLLGRDGKVIWEKAQHYHWPKSVPKLEGVIAEQVKATKVK